MSKKRAVKPNEIVFGYVVDIAIIDDRNQYVLRKYYINEYGEYVDDVMSTLTPSPDIPDEELIPELLNLAYVFANKERDKVYIESFILENITTAKNKKSRKN